MRPGLVFHWRYFSSLMGGGSGMSHWVLVLPPTPTYRDLCWPSPTQNFNFVLRIKFFISCLISWNMLGKTAHFRKHRFVWYQVILINVYKYLQTVCFYNINMHHLVSCERWYDTTIFFMKLNPPIPPPQWLPGTYSLECPTKRSALPFFPLAGQATLASLLFGKRAQNMSPNPLQL